MADAGWVALGGVAAGVIGKGLWDWRLAVGKVQADREARRDKRRERRDDLQRQTLLDIQPALTALLRVTIRAIQLEEEARRKNHDHQWGTMLPPDSMDEEMRQIFAQISLLQSRVRDEDLRDLVSQLSSRCTDIGMATERHEVLSIRSGLARMHLEAVQRSGQLIRTIDDDPEMVIR